MTKPVASTNVVINGFEKTAGSALSASPTRGITPQTVAATVQMEKSVKPMTRTSSAVIALAH